MWDPSYTHVHVFRNPPLKTVNVNCGMIIFQQLAEVGVLCLGHLLKVKAREIIPTLLIRAGYVGSTGEGRAVEVC